MLVIALVCLRTLLAVAPAQADDNTRFVGKSVAVVTKDGRMLRGTLTSEGDAQFIWLTASAEGATIKSRVPIDRIERIEESPPITLPAIGVATDHPMASNIEATAPEQPIVRSLSVATTTANWDAGASADGVGLLVQPHDGQGNIVPVTGSIRVELLVAKEDRSRRWRFRVVEHWQRRLSIDDFTADGFRVSLPFRHTVAESLDFRQRVAVLRVRMLVPGQGAFDAIVSDLPLAPYSWNRDRQQLNTGARRLPGEPR